MTILLFHVEDDEDDEEDIEEVGLGLGLSRKWNKGVTAGLGDEAGRSGESY